MCLVGEPGAGNLHARFDERGVETGVAAFVGITPEYWDSKSRNAACPAPLFDSTEPATPPGAPAGKNLVDLADSDAAALARLEVNSEGRKQAQADLAEMNKYLENAEKGIIASEEETDRLLVIAKRAINYDILTMDI